MGLSLEYMSARIWTVPFEQMIPVFWGESLFPLR